MARPRIPPAVMTLALSTFRRLPAPVRRALVRAGTPSFTVGAVCVLEHEGHILFLRQPHRVGWSLPGGLLDRGETPAHGVARELREETGIRLEVDLPVATQVNPQARRVDLVYRIVASTRPAVQVGGEARSASWLTAQEAVADADGPTREILAVVSRTLAGGTAGRVLDA